MTERGEKEKEKEEEEEKERRGRGKRTGIERTRKIIKKKEE